MTHPSPVSDHLSDGDLVRWTDGESTETERREYARHLNGCDDCHARLDAFRAGATDFTRSLERTDVPACDTPLPAALSWPRWRRMMATPALKAAAVLLMVVGAATASPVRPWIAERWGDLNSSSTVPVSAVETVPETDEVPGTFSTISFVLRGPTFVIELNARQAEGALEIVAVSDSLASAEILRGSGGDFVILPSRLRIANDNASDGDYRVSIPDALEEVRVRIAGEEAMVVNPRRAGERWVVQLRTDG